MCANLFVYILFSRILIGQKLSPYWPMIFVRPTIQNCRGNLVLLALIVLYLYYFIIIKFDFKSSRKVGIIKINLSHLFHNLKTRTILIITSNHIWNYLKRLSNNILNNEEQGTYFVRIFKENFFTLFQIVQ